MDLRCAYLLRSLAAASIALAACGDSPLGPDAPRPMDGRVLLQGQVSAPITWSEATGEIVFVYRGTGAADRIHAIEPRSGDLRPVGPPVHGALRFVEVPGGRDVAAEVVLSPENDYGTLVIPLDGGPVDTVPGGDVTPSPDRAVWAVWSWDTVVLLDRLTGARRPVAPCAPPDRGRLVFSRDGGLLACAQREVGRFSGWIASTRDAVPEPFSVPLRHGFSVAHWPAPPPRWEGSTLRTLVYGYDPSGNLVGEVGSDGHERVIFVREGLGPLPSARSDDGRWMVFLAYECLELVETRCGRDRLDVLVVDATDGEARRVARQELAPGRFTTTTGGVALAPDGRQAAVAYRGALFVTERW